MEREQPRSTTSEGFESMLLVLVAIGVALTWTQWLTVRLLAWATGTESATIRVHGTGFLGLWIQPDPSVATGLPVPGFVHWLVAIVIALLAVAAVTAVAVSWSRWRRQPEQRAGLASAHDVSADMGRRQLVRRATLLRPGLSRPAPTDLGFLLGSWKGTEVWMSVRESMILIGPSNSGKSYQFVIPMCVLAPGALVTTSTRPEVLVAAAPYRRAQGRPVAVFDPGNATGSGFAQDLLRFDLTAGCADPDVALKRAQRFCARNFGDVQNGSYWQANAQSVLAAMLHAAALDSAGIDRILLWYTGRARAREAVDIIRGHPDGDALVAEGLSAVIENTSQGGESLWSTAQDAIAYLRNRAVRRYTECDREHPGVDVAEFIRAGGSLFLIGDRESVRGVEAFVAGMVAEFVAVGQQLAGQAAGGRLDPPLWFVCDEAANFELDSLPFLVSAGGGVGMPTIAVYQAKSQMDAGIHKGAGAAMWDSAAVRVVLGGMMNAGEARDLETLIGTQRVERRTTNDGRGGSYSYALEDRPIFRAAEIAQLPFGRAIVLRARVKPFVVRLTGWNKRRDITTRRPRP